MADPIDEEGASRCQDANPSKAETLAGPCRKEKRKAAKKQKRKQIRKEIALRELEEEEARMNDPEEQLRIRMMEQEEAERCEKARKEFEERERLWMEAAAAAREAEEEAQCKLLEESQRKQVEQEKELEEEDDWEYVDEGPAEIIWQGNEIIVKKKRVKVSKKTEKEETERPTSNPLPPQSAAFAAYKNTSLVSTQQVFETAAPQDRIFGTEQDKAHCPFHIKTGACRFGSRCSRVHFYPDKSCTLLIKNMYNGPGLAWEQDEGLEYTDEEVERCFEEFYEDVHTEFLKFGEIVNFKVCRNGSFHLRGNVYVHYKSLESAVLAYNSINGRYFAGKQITCEFVGVTRWKVAICGEFMKSRLKTCSRGTACNFIHCFRNPGGDYEWADWDNPPPKYWAKKMAALFGPSDELANNDMELENRETRNSSRTRRADGDRYHRRRSRPREDCHAVSDGDYPHEKRARSHSKSSRRRSSRREATGSPNEFKQSSERYGTHDHDSGDDYYDESRVRCSSYSREQPSTRKKEQDLADEHNQSSDIDGSDAYPHVGKYKACDRDSGRYHAGNGSQSRSRTRTHSSSRRKEVDSPIENEIVAERSSRNISDKCGEKSRSRACDSEGYYPDSNRVQHGSHVRRRAHTSSQRKYTDSSYDDRKLEQRKCADSSYDRKLEQNYDSEDNEQYDGNQRSRDYSSNIGHDENGHWDKSRSSKGKRNNSLKMSYHDERGKSKEMYDFDDQDRYDGRCGSGDCDSSGDYEENRSPSKDLIEGEPKRSYCLKKKKKGFKEDAKDGVDAMDRPEDRRTSCANTSKGCGTKAIGIFCCPWHYIRNIPNLRYDISDHCNVFSPSIISMA
ncbi:hypothetical protein AAC387_Pa04g2470 [Persea americana]